MLLTSMATKTLTRNTQRYLNMAGCLAQQFYRNKLFLTWNIAPMDCRLIKTTSSQVKYQRFATHCSETGDTKDDIHKVHMSAGVISRCLLERQMKVSICSDRLSAMSFAWGFKNRLLYDAHSESMMGVCPISKRHLHMSCVLYRDESKVEETLEAIKDNMKKSEPVSGQEQSIGALTTQAQTSVVAPVKKKSLRERIVAELKHYYHGFRLLFIDIRVCARLIWQVLNGKTLMRREQKQLVRTTADMFRLVPFLVFIIVPFAEFLLPVALKLFPGMLPSTFKEEDREKEKVRKTLKMKLEMAKFLQDTIEETALQRQGATGESVHEFVSFMEKIRTSGVQTSNEEILKFSKLFEDEITLDNLSYQQLSALCKMVEVTSVGPSYFLRFQLEMKLRQLEADDKMIQKEGIDSMAVWELQEACRQRGMRSFGVPESRLKWQLAQWLDLHLNHKIPGSLLLLSRTLYLPEHLSTEDQLKATISALPDSMAEEAKVKILEVSGDRVDNKSKLEIIRQEEEMIQQEKAELERLRTEEELKKAQAAKAKLEAEALHDIPEKAAEKLIEPSKVPLESAEAEIPLKEMLVDKASQDLALEKEEIDSKDLEEIENILDHAADRKKEMKKEFEELEALKEDFSEYKENLGELKGVMEQSGASLTGLTESKAAQRLSRKVSKMIEQMDLAVNDLAVQKAALMDDIKAKEGRVKDPLALSKDEAARKQILDQISEEKDNLITITELMDSIQSLQKIPDSTKFEKIAKVLDADHDGVIDYSDAMKVIELLGKESVKLNAEQLAEIMLILKKEKEVTEDEKKVKKLQQQQQQQQQQQILPSQKSTEAEKETKQL